LGFVAAQLIYSTNVDAIKAATHTEGRFMANIAAVFLLAGFLALNRSRFVAKLAPLGRYTYLAFLCHMLVIELLRSPLKDVPGYGSVGVAFASSVLVFALSLGVSWLIQNTRFLKALRA
jgi:peptidoglycan/LPS O-acetylase OafA/YrhL